jgi:tetratricopeptide (TPR) repeat protein
MWEKSAESYSLAASAHEEMPIYSQNMARALEKAGDQSSATSAWQKAAQGFYKQQAWDDMNECIYRLRELGYDKTELDTLQALAAYSNGDVQNAFDILEKINKKGIKDSAAVYVYGLLLLNKDKRRSAIKAFKEATALAPETALYHYRLAESLFFIGDDCSAALAEALRLNPKDGWTLNLAANFCLNAAEKNYHNFLIISGELPFPQEEKAIYYFSQSALALPDEAIPCINLSQVFFKTGRLEEAIKALGDWPSKDGASANHLGNLYAASGQLEEALSMYEKALIIDEKANSFQNSIDYRTNYAAALIELGEYIKAEMQLAKALESGIDIRALMLMGDVLSELAEFSRAELAYRQALEMNPNDTIILKRLYDHYTMRRRYNDAQKIAERIKLLNKR